MDCPYWGRRRLGYHQRRQVQRDSLCHHNRIDGWLGSGEVISVDYGGVIEKKTQID